MRVRYGISIVLLLTSSYKALSEYARNGYTSFFQTLVCGGKIWPARQHLLSEGRGGRGPQVSCQGGRWSTLPCDLSHDACDVPTPSAREQADACETVGCVTPARYRVGISVWGSLSWGVSVQGVSVRGSPWQRPPPPVNRMTDRHV